MVRQPDTTPGQPNVTATARAAQEARDDRRARALRDNLLRRKQQARERREPAAEPEGPAVPDQGESGARPDPP